MAITQTVTPTYPNVPPQGNGVPAVLREAGTIENAVVQVIADGAQVLKMFGLFGQKWGIFDENGQPVLIANSVISVDYRNEWRIATHPIERGAFQSYNKVKQPFDVRVVFAVSGQQTLLQSLIPGNAIFSAVMNTQQESRKESLAMLDRAIATTKLVTVITPEATYPSVNITHYDYRREARSGGVSMIRVEVWCEEVRVSAESAFSDGGELTGTKPVGGEGGGTGSGTGAPAPGSTTTGTAAGGPGGAGQANAPSQPEGANPVSGGTVQGEPVPGPQPPQAPTGGTPEQSGVTSAQYGPDDPARVVDVNTTKPVTPGHTPAYSAGQYQGHISPANISPSGPNGLPVGTSPDPWLSGPKP